jgi:hypothetical protein
MSLIDDLREKLDRLQKFAADYFDLLYKTIFPFDRMPEVPGGGDILTGGFAVVLLYLARYQLAQPLDAGTIGKIVVAAFLVLLILCGLSLAFDPQLKARTEADPSTGSIAVANYRKLVSVVCTGMIVGYMAIALDAVTYWAASLIYSAASRDAGFHRVATVSAVFASLVLLANTLRQVGPSFFYSARNLIWAVAIAIMIGVGIQLTVGWSEAIW